jgi:acetoacetate decarboxylase
VTRDYLLEIPSPEAAYSMPLDAPLLGPPPGRFKDGEILTIQYRSDADAVRALVPPPLEPTTDTVMVQIARWGDVPGLGRNTYECNVMLGVRFEKDGKVTEGSYSPYFYVDSDRAMAGGREFHGQPKRLGEVFVESRGDLLVGTVARNGLPVFTGTLPYKARPATLSDVRRRIDLVTNINLKILPHIDGRTAVKQLTARDLDQIEVSECWTGPCTAEIHPHATAPMYRLPVREHLDGFYWRADFSLVGGIVLHDYLAMAPKDHRR